jgi:hypothetical protein
LIERLICETSKGEQAEQRAEEDSSHRCISIIGPAKGVFKEIVTMHLSKGEQSSTGGEKTGISISGVLVIVDTKHNLVTLTQQYRPKK